MTGFGRSELKSAEGHIRVEIKTVNHKFLEISPRIPGHLAEFEDLIRKSVGREITRGKVNLFISSPDPAVFSSRLLLNENLAREVAQKISRLKTLLKLSVKDDSLILREVLRTPDLFVKDASSGRRRLFSKELLRAVTLALESLKQSRLLEGKSLEKDLRNRLAEIKKDLRGIEKRLPSLARAYKKSLEGRLKEFLKNGEVDRGRLTVEVAQYLKNSDISEEVTRLKSHFQAMEKTLSEDGETGRKIDFIAQEMSREANTMGAKSGDAAISGRVIQIKGTIEKIREQAQNVE
ncbi:MAG: YicC family protein [Candidatus Omnitrophica bacterium]|nr:YicC family protein [Candidatus Omnitrophota bacterium]